MNAALRVQHSTLLRMRYGRVVPIILLLFLIMQFVLFFFVLDCPSNAEYDDFIRDETTYQKSIIEQKQGISTERTDTRIALYEYTYLENKDYYDSYVSMPFLYSYGTRLSVLLSFWNITVLTHFILFLLCIGITVFVFSDYTSGGLKNYIFAGIERENIFKGHGLAMLKMLIVSFLATTIIEIVFGARYMGQRLLLCSGNKVWEIVFAETFFTKIAGFFLLDVFAIMLTAFLSIIIKKKMLSLGILYLAVLILAILYFVFRKVDINRLSQKSVGMILSMIPIFRTIFDPNPAFSVQQAVSYILDIILGSMLFFVSKKLARRQDV